MSDITNRFLFSHAGMLQSERLEQAPDPDAMRISGRSFEDLVGRAAEFARSLVFFNDENKPDGDWSAFFKEVYDYDRKRVKTEVIDYMVRNSSVPPHLALLFAFFKMSLVTQADMNTLTARQLEFYFKDVLGFRMRKGTEGHVTVFAQLGRNVNSVSIPKGLVFDAGKDADGKAVAYEAVDELRLGNEKVVALARYSVKDGFEMESMSGADSGTDSGADVPPAGGETNRTHALCIAAKILDIPGCDMMVSLGSGVAANSLQSLRAEYTSADGWTPFDDARNLRIRTDMPPITRYDSKVHGEGLDTSCPVIRFVSENGYGSLSSVSPSAIKKVKVTVSDYVPGKLVNKYGEVDNASGTNPFGPDGRKGDWFEVPLPFVASKFELDTVSLNDASAIKIPSGKDAVSKRRFSISDGSCDQASLSKEYADLVMAAYTETDVVKKAQAKLKLEKKQITALFPRLLSPAKVKKASGEGDVENVFLQLPCGTEIVTGKSTLTGHEDLADRISRLSASLQSNTSSLTAGSAFNGTKEGTALFIALSETESHIGQISLFLENSGQAVDPGTLSWSYRKNGRWVDFNKTAILRDTTCGLSQSGIVIFDFKEPLTSDDSGLFGGLACIRCVCSNGNAAYIKEVLPRAIELSFSESSIGTGPGGEPLPKETISKAVNSVVGVKAFSQPFAGESGTRAEDGEQFHRRVAERLRHKGRSWSVWDYETLVLEKFVDISYVKCLPACGPDGVAAPGHVSVIIIPKSYADSLKPYPGNKIVNDVHSFLQSSASPFAGIHVIGPSYREVSVGANISLKPGYNDAVRYDALVSEALTDYLRPWVGYKDGRRFKDGDGVSDIIAFLESLPFVDIIKDLVVKVDGEAVDMNGSILRTKSTEVMTSAAVHGIKCQTAD